MLRTHELVAKLDFVVKNSPQKVRQRVFPPAVIVSEIEDQSLVFTRPTDQPFHPVHRKKKRRKLDDRQLISKLFDARLEKMFPLFVCSYRLRASLKLRHDGGLPHF